jgi:hypothetical protein
LTYRKINYGAEETPPATHNISGTSLHADNKGLIKIVGKKSGEIKLRFRLKHKLTGAVKEIEKTVTVKETPIVYSITEIETIDQHGKAYPAVSMNGGQMHTQG